MKLLTEGGSSTTAFAFNGGQPITVYNGDDTSGTNEFTQRVNRVSNPFAGVSHKIQTVDGSKFVQWFNPNAYRRARRKHLGQLSPQQHLRTRAMRMSISRSSRIRNSQSTTFR